MCLTSILTPVLPLRSLSVITLPIAAGFTPVLVNRSSRPHAALVSKKVRTTNRAMRGFMLYLPYVELFGLDERLQTNVVVFFLYPDPAVRERDRYHLCRNSGSDGFYLQIIPRSRGRLRSIKFMGGSSFW